MSHSRRNHSLRSYIEKSFPLFVFILVLVLYRDCLLKNYFINDELGRLGEFRNPLVLAKKSFFVSGQPFTEFTRAVIYNFADLSQIKITFIRLINLILMAGIATFLFRIIKSSSKNFFLSVCFILVFISQLTYQGFIAYGLHFISYQFAFCLSLMSLLIFFQVKFKLRRPKFTYFLTFLILFIAFHFAQVATFFCLIPLTSLILFDQGERQKEIQDYLILFALAFLCAACIYAFASSLWIREGHEIHKIAKGFFYSFTHSPADVFFRSLNVTKYHSAFEVWTYPSVLKVEVLKGNVKKNIEISASIVWFALWVITFARDIHKNEEKKIILNRHALFFCCIAMAAFLFVLESPLQSIRHREHIRFTLSNIVLLSSFYFFFRIFERRSYRVKIAGKIFAVIFLMFLLEGTSSNFSQSYVGVAAGEFSYVEKKMSEKNKEDLKQIVVVYPKDNFCIKEPCGIWSGNVLRGYRHNKMTRKGMRRGFYRYVMKSLGFDWEKIEINYVWERPERMQKTDLLIDWNDYLDLQRLKISQLF